MNCTSGIMMAPASPPNADPMAKAREFASAGAEWIHVTDLDGVASPGNGWYG